MTWFKLFLLGGNHIKTSFPKSNSLKPDGMKESL